MPVSPPYALSAARLPRSLCATQSAAPMSRQWHPASVSSRRGLLDSERGLGSWTRIVDSDRGLGSWTRIVTVDSDRGLGSWTRIVDSDHGLGPLNVSASPRVGMRLMVVTTNLLVLNLIQDSFNLDLIIGPMGAARMLPMVVSFYLDVVLTEYSCYALRLSAKSLHVRLNRRKF